MFLNWLEIEISIQSNSTVVFKKQIEMYISFDTPMVLVFSRPTSITVSEFFSKKNLY